MTREDAIENLKGLLESNYVDSFEDEENESLRMAIQALEQNESAEEWYKLFVEKLEQESTDENLHREREQAYMQGYEDASKKYRQEPCEDCVSRQEIIEHYTTGEMANVHHIDKNHLLAFVEQLSPVTPQPKTGHWIAYEVQLPDRTILNYRCSVCGRKLIGYNTETLSEAPFCHCGAKMVEPQESEDKE